MEEKDDLKVLIDSSEGIERGAEKQQVSHENIMKGISSKQSQCDMLDFGLVKIWTVLLGIFSILYVDYQRRQSYASSVSSDTEGQKR